jgi:hypothetical protein
VSQPRHAPLLFVSAVAFSSCLNLPDEPVEKRSRPPLYVKESNITDRREDVARDIRVKLTFNQPLDPDSMNGVEMSIESGSLKTGGRKKYDLLTSTLTFIPNGTLRANLWYKFILKKPPLSVMGTRSKQDEINILFKTGTRLAQDEPPAPSAVNFADEVFPFFGANCRCHGSFNPLMGVQLVYDTPEEALAGAVDTDSKEWKNWKIIEPARHERSYLMYKLLGDDRLGMPTVTGDRMPPPPEPEIAMDAIEKIRDWIEQGAGSGT